MTGERWRTDPLYRTSFARSTPWDFHFSAGNYIGSGAPPGHVWPRRYWVLCFPLWLPPALLLCWGVLRLFRGNTHSGGTAPCGEVTAH